MTSSETSNSLPLILGALGLTAIGIGYLMTQSTKPREPRIVGRVLRRRIQQAPAIRQRVRATKTKAKTRPSAPSKPVPSTPIGSWRIKWYRGDRFLQDKVLIKKPEAEAIEAARAGISGATQWVLKDMRLNKTVREGPVQRS